MGKFLRGVIAAYFLANMLMFFIIGALIAKDDVQAWLRKWLDETAAKPLPNENEAEA